MECEIQHIKGIDQSIPANDRPAGDIQASLLQSDQAGSQIAAVHCGDIARRKWIECARVIPVQKVVTLFFKPIHAIERISNAQCQFTRSNITQVIRRKGGEQKQADICWRGAMGYQPARLLLKMIGREPVVIWTHKMLKVQPGGACQQM